MNSSLDYLLKELTKRMNLESTEPPKLITSGKHFNRWLADRMGYRDQILINAIICRESEMRGILDHLMMEIDKELSELAKVKILPYPYDNIDEMRAVVQDLIAHFNAHLSVDDVIVSLG